VANGTNSAGQVTILLGNGDGTFNVGTSLSGPVETASLTSADFNHDGKLDIAFVDSSLHANKVYIYLGNGDGTFRSAPTLAGDGDTDQIAAGDFNGDRKPDLAITDYFANTVSIALGNGNGTFGVTTTYPTGQNPQAITVADFTGDGKLDVATDSIYDSVSILPGNGDGTLAPYMGFAIASGASPAGLTSADFVNNGSSGVAVTGSSLNTVSVLINYPVVFLSTNALNYGKQTVRTSSTGTVVVNNSGAASMVINSISVSGTNAGDFSQTNTCGTKLAPAKQCSITVTFTPRAKGARTATISIADTAKGSPQRVTLSGTGQ